ncbi:MAG: hypothetical protein IJ484_09825 [Oscillospiraceae bacterium]|nr:hypothetical protein [Oscillospiraceae bacterium]
MKAKRKALILSICVLLLSVTMVTGTLALAFDVDEKVNTFTVGQVRIELNETLVDKNGNPVDENGAPLPSGADLVKTGAGNIYKLTAGASLLKDPTVTVQAGSDACWLFVLVEETEGVDRFVAWRIDAGWMPLDAQAYPGVYCREVDATDRDLAFPVLDDNAVTVKGVNAQMLAGLTRETLPTLNITAYAVQKSGVDTRAEAWELVRAAAG